MTTVFFSYSHADEALRDQLEKQLSMLKRQGIIETWHDRRIGAGEEIDGTIDERINTDDIILLLVSSDFLSSNYCYDIEMTRALERHSRREAIVIPVILRHCDWKNAPFGKLNATPPDGRPITTWPDRDEAFLEVVNSVRAAAARFTHNNHRPSTSNKNQNSTIQRQPLPRSSNLRVAKEFNERERDQFRIETFEYIARFFENSINELIRRNSNIDGRFLRVDANRFFTTIYRDGTAKSRGTIFIGDSAFTKCICYTNGETNQSGSANEILHVEADDQGIFIKSLGMASVGRATDKKQKLSQEGAAELFWQMLIAPLQR